MAIAQVASAGAARSRRVAIGHSASTGAPSPWRWAGHTSGTGGLCGRTQFLVNSVDLASGTLVENFNPEVQGQTLDFTVTVVDIFPA